MHVQSHYRYFVVVVFVTFMLLHQADKLLIGQVLENIKADLDISDQQVGALGTGALVVGAIFYPLWGYLYDRFSRAKLLALASFIWGFTTSFGAAAVTYPALLLARSSTGIDDSSYPGIYSLISDYFRPEVRGKVNSLLQMTAPIGFVLSLILVLTLNEAIGWRNIFLLTGALGIVVGLFILFGVRDMPRGSAEPELQDIKHLPAYRFNLMALRSLFRKRSIIPLYIQGFFGVFPLQVISFWFFAYLQRERGYDNDLVFPIMAAAVIMMALGSVVGGTAGDAIFKRYLRGRVVVCFIGVLTAAVLLFVALTLPLTVSPMVFGGTLAAAAFFVLFSGPNIVATVYDITLPEVRSSALAVQYFIENIGAATAPFLVGVLSEQIGLTNAILIVCTLTYGLCAAFLAFAVIAIPPDILTFREQILKRAAKLEVDEI
jgi:MFS transporter, Spinster family, sphingosine-1-phosphate transporter